RVDLLRLLTHDLDGAAAKVIQRIGVIRGKIQVRCNRISRVRTSRRAGNVRKVAIVDSIGPQIIELRFEAVNYSRVAAEINGLVDIVLIRSSRNKEEWTEVSAAEQDRVLAGE